MTVLQVLVKDIVAVLDAAAKAPDSKDFYTLIESGLYLQLSCSERSDFYSYKLFFRSLATPDNDQASFYISKVLMEPQLQLPNNILDQPGNAHKLLAKLCALNAKPAWQGVEIARYKNPQFTLGHALLRELKEKLTANAVGQIKLSSTIAQKRREEFGAFYLSLDNCVVEVPDELSLRYIFQVCPLPLVADFTKNEDMLKHLSRTVEALNRRYKLLRSCGLEPQCWLLQDEAAKDGLSIGYLEQLQHLRHLAMNTEAWVAGEKQMAFKEAFAELLSQSSLKKPNVAGFKHFSDWLSSDVGLAMLGVKTTTYNDEVLVQDFPTDPQPDVEYIYDAHLDEGGALDLPGSQSFEPEPSATELFAALVTLYPKVFEPDPTMHYFFSQLLDSRGQWEAEVLDEKFGKNHPQFSALLANDPRYKALSDAALVKRLWQDAENLVANNVKALFAKKRR